ncbi:MAG: MerR family transcriptional regulator [Bacteroidetes bacterium]|nr:MerR family transcriptional regulator [Bacteroidota bacterium]MBP6401481.1 MerR family transcriptional regulator [Bacteroidia bacterium]MBK6837238.1 MerR family transcriptional regulator [Bacteroidota bacterium]MBK9523357.1 MerR family transcriptional regulator [Bacteroidota bacterium]MBK9541100.1 MerR family transcriptional regulator [Bacteroidota bacterium]
MPYKEKEIEKLYYTIGEVASMFDVNTSHIRFWSKEFDIIKPATNKKGNRLYTYSDIENFKKIYHLVKEKGFTLKGAKTELKEMKSRLKDEEIVLVNVSDIETDQLSDNPVNVPFSAPEIPFADDFVDKMAMKNSFERIKSTLLDIQKELTVMEEK